MKANDSKPKPSNVPIISLELHGFVTPPQYKASNKHCIAPTMSMSPGRSIWKNTSFRGRDRSMGMRAVSGTEKVKNITVAAKAPTGRLM